MAEFTLDDLNAITEPAIDDLFHLRNTSGLDKKVTFENLKGSIVLNDEKTADFSVIENAAAVDKVQIYKNTSSSTIVMTFGGSGEKVYLLPGTVATIIWNGTDSSIVSLQAAAAHLQIGQDLQSLCQGDVTVDGSTVTRLDAGIYNNVHFTGNAAIGYGKYSILGDLTIDSGVTVTLDYWTNYTSGTPRPYGFEFFGSGGTIPLNGSTAGSVGIAGRVAGSSPNTISLGGGNGGAGYISSRRGGSGGGCPMGGGGAVSGSPEKARCFIILNVVGVFDNNGTFYGHGENGVGNSVTSYTGSGGGAGGVVLARTLSTGADWGTFTLDGGNGGGDTQGGGGGGGGILQRSAPEADAGVSSDVTGGAGGSTGGGAGGAGTSYYCDLSTDEGKLGLIDGRKYAATGDEKTRFGAIVRYMQGWW